MYKSMKFLSMLIILLMSYLPTNSYSDQLFNQMKCGKTIRISDAYSTNGHVRADQSILCVTSDFKDAVLLYRASAMIKASFPNGNFAPWIGIRLYDNQGKEIYKKNDLQIATVIPCGGYHSHAIHIPKTNKTILSRTVNASIHMSGDKPNHSNNCGRPSGTWEGLRYDIQNGFKDLTDGKLSEEEKEALMIIGAL